MDFPDVKALKKLADACRKAGIKQFKSGAFEFTLSDEVPVSDYKKKKALSDPSAVSQGNGMFESDTLEGDELLFWSTGSITDESSGA